MLPYRGHVAPDRPPSPDLPLVVFGAASHVITNQLAGNSPRQSVMYFPPKTPRRSMAFGVNSGWKPGTIGFPAVIEQESNGTWSAWVRGALASHIDALRSARVYSSLGNSDDC